MRSHVWKVLLNITDLDCFTDLSQWYMPVALWPTALRGWECRKSCSKWTEPSALLSKIYWGSYLIQHGQTCSIWPYHYSDVIVSTVASQITSLTIVYTTVYSGADQRKHQSSASLALVRGIHRWPVISPHKGPVTREIVHLMTSSWLREKQTCSLLSLSNYGYNG